MVEIRFNSKIKTKRFGLIILSLLTVSKLSELNKLSIQKVSDKEYFINCLSLLINSPKITIDELRTLSDYTLNRIGKTIISDNLFTSDPQIPKQTSRKNIYKPFRDFVIEKNKRHQDSTERLRSTLFPASAFDSYERLMKTDDIFKNVALMTGTSVLNQFYMDTAYNKAVQYSTLLDPEIHNSALLDSFRFITDNCYTTNIMSSFIKASEHINRLSGITGHLESLSLPISELNQYQEFVTRVQFNDFIDDSINNVDIIFRSPDILSECGIEESEEELQEAKSIVASLKGFQISSLPKEKIIKIGQYFTTFILQATAINRMLELGKIDAQVATLTMLNMLFGFLVLIDSLRKD